MSKRLPTCYLFRMYKKALFVLLSFLTLLPVVTTPLALTLGLVFGYFLGCPFQAQVPRATKWLLQAAVVGLGFGIPLRQVLETGRDGLPVAIGTIAFALIVGFALAALLKIRSNTTALITVGTAICGGSAIAAVAPTLRAKPEELSLALAAVFSLNAIALFLFPWIGHNLQLTPEQFGLWSALAIHDTSSVVGAASTFGPHALAIATTVKLSRVIWLIPITALFALAERHKGAMSIPWFVLFFILAAGLKSSVESWNPAFELLASFAKQALCLVLFWIGSGLNKEALARVGAKPFVFAISLWVLLASASLFVVTH